MLRNLLVAGLFCMGLVLVSVGIAATPQRGRTLVEGELWNAFGGEDQANRCCTAQTSCEGTATSCGGPEMMCASTYQLVIYATNNKYCGMFKADTTCTQGSSVDCKVQTQCVWDTASSTCKTGTFVGSRISTPETCSPSCG